jgi:hypothetical protein
MTWLMQMVCGALGGTSPDDGLYLKSVKFDVDEDGRCEIETTPDPAEAYQFKSARELLKTWKRQSVVRPLRNDQEPNRPLTAWTIECVNRIGAAYIEQIEHCDFCQTAKPTRMYAHPYIESKVLETVFAPGHWVCCDRCGDLLEAGDLDGLMVRVALPPQLRVPEIVDEFKRIYRMISRTSEACEPPEVYRKRYS